MAAAKNPKSYSTIFWSVAESLEQLDQTYVLDFFESEKDAMQFRYKLYAFARALSPDRRRNTLLTAEEQRREALAQNIRDVEIRLRGATLECVPRWDTKDARYASLALQVLAPHRRNLDAIRERAVQEEGQEMREKLWGQRRQAPEPSPEPHPVATHTEVPPEDHFQSALDKYGYGSPRRNPSAPPEPLRGASPDTTPHAPEPPAPPPEGEADLGAALRAMYGIPETLPPRDSERAGRGGGGDDPQADK